MGKAENFSLFTAVIGLIADSIALISIAISASSSSKREIPDIVSTFMLLILFYGWFVVSWYIRRSYHLKSKNKPPQKQNASQRNLSATIAIVTAIGLLLLPMWILWGRSTEDIPDKDTSTLQTTNNSQNDNNSENTTEMGSTAAIWAPFIEALAGGLIVIILILGMPAIYDDMEWYWE